MMVAAESELRTEIIAGLAAYRQDDATKELPVIVVSGHATVQDAVQAIKLGASDFFEKPLNRDRILVSVKNALRTSELARGRSRGRSRTSGAPARAPRHQASRRVSASPASHPRCQRAKSAY